MTYQVFILAAGNERGGGASHLIAFASAAVQNEHSERFKFVLVGSGYLQERLAQLNVPMIVLDGGIRTSASKLASYMKNQVSEIEGTGSILLHAHGPRMNIIAYLASRRVRILWTSTLHSDPHKDFLSSWWKGLVFSRLNIWVLNKAAALFAVSSELAGQFPRKQIFLVTNAAFFQPLAEPVEVYRSALRQRIGVSPDSRLIGMAARLNPVKDIPTAIRAFSRFIESSEETASNVHLVIAGDGPSRQQLEALTKQLAIADRVHFLGFINEVGEFFAALDIHVLSSLSEGTGLSILEAGYYNVVNIGTEIEGVQQMLVNTETGLLFPVGDVERLKEAFRELIRDELFRRRLADAFRRRVLPKYSPEQMLNSYMKGYSTLAGE